MIDWSERRAVRRRQLYRNVEVAVYGPQTLVGWLSDLSTTGMQMDVPSALDADSRLVIALDLRGFGIGVSDILKCECIVRRCVPLPHSHRYVIGLEFVAMAPECLMMVSHIINRCAL